MELPLRALEDKTKELLDPREFKLFSPFTERHGSWEVAFYKQVPGLYHFISLALTPESPPPLQGVGSYVVEIWIDLEQLDENNDNRDYERRMVRQFTVRSKEEFESSNFEAALKSALADAIEVLLKFDIANLSATHSPRWTHH